jgi:hypothetical protein
MNTYSIFMEFRGGTFISQFSAASVQAALLQWRDHIVTQDVQHLRPELFLEAFRHETDIPTNIDTTISIWIWTLLVGKHMMTVHVIKTDVSPEAVPVRESIFEGKQGWLHPQRG